MINLQDLEAGLLSFENKSSFFQVDMLLFNIVRNKFRNRFQNPENLPVHRLRVVSFNYISKSSFRGNE